MKELLYKTTDNNEKLTVYKNKKTFVFYLFIHISISLGLIIYLNQQQGDFSKKWIFYVAFLIFLIYSLFKYLRPIINTYTIIFDSKNQTLLINKSTLKRFNEVETLIIKSQNQSDSDICSLIFKFKDESEYLVLKADISKRKNFLEVASVINSFTKIPFKTVDGKGLFI